MCVHSCVRLRTITHTLKVDGLQEHVDLHAPGSSEVRQRCSMALQVLRVLLQAATANPELRLLDAMAVREGGGALLTGGVEQVYVCC